MVKPVSVLDYRALAKKRLPHFLYEYFDGGSYAEQTLRRCAAGILHGHGQVDHLARAGGFAVAGIDGDAVDEDHTQVAVGGRTSRGDVEVPAGGQEFLDGGV